MSGIKLELLSYREKELLQRLNVEVMSVGVLFHRKLNLPDMITVGQIISDLHYRTDDEDNHANFAVGDWIIQFDEWFEGEQGVPIFSRFLPTPMYTCFISYSSKDEPFATKLYFALRSANLRVWYAPKDIKGGAKIYDQVDSAIQEYERLLIILSTNSLQSEWVVSEIRNAHNLEKQTGERKLFPIRLVSMDVLQQWRYFDADVGKDIGVELREYFIPDFSGWENEESFLNNFGKLLDDLKKPSR